MPELIIVYMQQCKDISKRQVQIKDYIVTRIHGYEFIDCTCTGFKYQKHCKHLNMAQDSVCTWHEMTGVPQTDEQKKNKICPECGGETEIVGVGV